MAENETISHQKATSEANHGQSILAAHCGPLKTRLSRDSLSLFACHRTEEAELFQQIGRLQMELEWLKKKSQLL